jgi:thymidylate synthase
MNQIDRQYQNLLIDIIHNGVEKETRNGKTKSVFGRQIRHKMKEGFPLITTKKMYWRGIVTELLWFLRGDTNIKFLVDNNCHIWDGDAFKNFMNKSEGDPDLIWNQEQFIELIKTDDEFAEKWGDLGPVYGKQWRAFCGYEKVPSGWNHHTVTDYKKVPKCDQIQDLIRDLKTNPDSRRLMVSSWNVGELEQMTLPPCHYGFQVYTRELSMEERSTIQIQTNDYASFYTKEEMDNNGIPQRAISLMWNQRSVDTFLGLPFNIASYGLLLEIIAKEVNMVPDELIGNLGDTHLYYDHLDQSRKQITRKPYPLPTLDIHPGILDYDMEKYPIDIFEIKNYQSHPTIKAPLFN